MAGQQRARGAAGGGRHRGEREVRGRDAHPRGHAGARAGDDRRLDQQQADRADLDGDREAGDQTGEQCGGGIHRRPVMDAAPRERKPCSPGTDRIAAVDETDREILSLLRADGRISWRDLGAAVGLSANAAADRVRRLRRSGVITGFVALVDPAAAGRRLEALVGVTLAAGTDSDDFATAAAQLEPGDRGPPPHAERPTTSCASSAATRPSSTLCCARLRLRLGAADTETTIVLRAGPPQPPGHALGTRSQAGDHSRAAHD